MMNKVLSLFLFLLLYNSYSQQICTRVIYKTEISETQNKTNTSQSEKTKQHLNDVRKHLSEIEFELLFNDRSSIFKEIEKMPLENESLAYKIAKRTVDGVYYKDNVDSIKITQNDTYGKKYNIKKKFNEYNWLISRETKTINGYKCYKATCIYEEIDKIRNKQLTFTPEVWFTPSIPSSFGPKGLDGLPGLVLEGTFNNKIYFYAIKIEFDYSINDKTIMLDTKIPIITEDEYIDILKNNLEIIKKNN